MKTISIANQKGGCGKTTTAINLASAIAVAGKRILLIDLDPQAHATYGLGQSNHSADKSIYNILTDNAERHRALTDCVFNVSKNLDLIPSSILLSTIEQELIDKEDAVSKLYDVLTSVRLNYDYVIIDGVKYTDNQSIETAMNASLQNVKINMNDIFTDLDDLNLE